MMGYLVLECMQPGADEPRSAVGMLAATAADDQGQPLVQSVRVLGPHMRGGEQGQVVSH